MSVNKFTGVFYCDDSSTIIQLIRMYLWKTHWSSTNSFPEFQGFHSEAGSLCTVLYRLSTSYTFTYRRTSTCISNRRQASYNEEHERTVHTYIRTWNIWNSLHQVIIYNWTHFYWGIYNHWLLILTKWYWILEFYCWTLSISLRSSFWIFVWIAVNDNENSIK